MLIHELTNGHCIPFWRWHQGRLDQPHRYVAKTSSTLVGHSRSTLALAFEIERMASFINGNRVCYGMFQEVRKIQGVMATDLDLDSCRSLLDTNKIAIGRAIYPKSNHNSQKMSQSQSHPAGKGSQLSHEQLRCESHFIILFNGPIFLHTWAPWQLCHCACPWSHLLRSLAFLGGEFFPLGDLLETRLVFVAVSPTSTCWNLAFISGLTSDLTTRLPKYDDFRGYFTTDFTTSLEQSAHIWKMMKQKNKN